MKTSCGNSHHVAQAQRNVRLAREMFSPRSDHPIALERQTVISSRVDSHDLAQTNGDRRLAMTIVSPRGDCPGALQRQTVRISPGNGYHVAQAYGDVCFAVVINSPHGDRSVALQCQSVVASRSNSHHVVQACGDVRLARGIFSPRGDHPVALERQTPSISPHNRQRRAGGDNRVGEVSVTFIGHRGCAVECEQRRAEHDIKSAHERQRIVSNQTPTIDETRRQAGQQVAHGHGVCAAAHRHWLGKVGVVDSIKPPLEPDGGVVLIRNDRAVERGHGVARARHRQRGGDR